MRHSLGARLAHLGATDGKDHEEAHHDRREAEHVDEIENLRNPCGACLCPGRGCVRRAGRSRPNARVVADTSEPTTSHCSAMRQLVQRMDVHHGSLCRLWHSGKVPSQAAASTKAAATPWNATI